MNKYSRVYAEIDLNQIRRNIVNIKEKLGDDTKIMAVVKADGYGHGSVVCSKYIDDLVDFYGVATVDEAKDLISSFIDSPILVLGPVFEENMVEAIYSDIRITIFDIETAKKLSRYASLIGRNCYVHIKVDTGMSRIGFKYDDKFISAVKEISKLPYIVIEGLFTHFANADEQDKGKAEYQFTKFEAIVDEIKKENIDIPIIHCANSAATLDMAYSVKNMVRAGIIIYGYYPSDDVDKSNICVKPALTLKSHVIFVKEVEEGTGVSYNSTYVSDKKIKVATIPVGYADGYPRSLSNIGYVLINGNRANIIGRICMDQFMVDVTGIDVNIDDEVVLIGKSENKEITLEELCTLSNKFNYEFMCGLSKRIPRLYFKDDKLVDEVNYFYTCRRI